MTNIPNDRGTWVYKHRTIWAWPNTTSSLRRSVPPLYRRVRRKERSLTFDPCPPLPNRGWKTYSATRNRRRYCKVGVATASVAQNELRPRTRCRTWSRSSSWSGRGYRCRSLARPSGCAGFGGGTLRRKGYRYRSRGHPFEVLGRELGLIEVVYSMWDVLKRQV